MPADVPIPTKARAARIPPQVGAAPAAAWAAIPMAETKTKIGRRPYTFAIGDHINGETPAKTIGTVVWYDASTTLMWSDLARGTNAEFCRWIKLCPKGKVDGAHDDCLRKWAKESKERYLQENPKFEPSVPVKGIYDQSAQNIPELYLKFIFVPKGSSEGCGRRGKPCGSSFGTVPESVKAVSSCLVEFLNSTSGSFMFAIKRGVGGWTKFWG
jgi:hypothetical protein